MADTPLTLERLAERHRAPDAAPDGAHSLVDRRLAGALASIGWRAASDLPAEELAPQLRLIVDRALRTHRDLPTLRRELAQFLMRHAHTLDGGQAHPSQWEPAASQLLSRYVDGVGGGGPW